MPQDDCSLCVLVSERHSNLMTWTEAVRKGRDRWLIWIAVGSLLGCAFLVKGGTPPEFFWAMVIGAANGAGVGFAVGPAAEKGSAALSGSLAGTPFYFIGIGILVTELMGREQIRDLPLIVVPLPFLIVGSVISVAQFLRVRRSSHGIRQSV
jgi:hypothetical protein